ncbi:MAG: SpoIIE family protein phosphatase, partial [candidate division Zixibacteria bacterium]|nr:SpoIIE family protein phosphatase [candidate division Zixibacteria bacterium]
VERKFAKSMFVAVLIVALALISVIISVVFEITFLLDYLVLFSMPSIIPAVVFSYFVLKFNFMDLFIKKSIFYTLLTGIVLVLYVVVIKNTSDWITTYAGVKTGVVEALSIIILVFLLYPLRETIQAGVDKIFFKTKYNYQKILKDLSQRLTSIVDLKQLLDLLVEKITNSLHCKNISIFLESKTGDFALVKQKASHFPEDYTLSKKDKMIKYLQDKREPVVLKNLENDKNFVEASGENRCFLRFKESKTDLIFPMKVKDKMIGTLSLGPKLSGDFYSLEDMDLLSTIADQTAIAIENARLYLESLEKKRLEEELALARQIQQNLLPKSAPQVEGFDIAGINIPSQQVGGDYFDFIEYEDGRLGIAIGDVSGKGVSAALLMSNLQATLKGQVEHDLPIERTMNIINSLVFRHTASDRFATFFYGILKLKENSLEYVNAGHNPPILLRGNKEAEFLEEGGLVLGVLPEVEYCKGEIKLQKGDLIVCYTDGVTETINTRDEEFGIEKLIEIMYNNYNVRASEIQERI